MGLDHTPAPASCCRDFGERPCGLAGTSTSSQRIPICGKRTRAYVCACVCACVGVGMRPGWVCCGLTARPELSPCPRCRVWVQSPMHIPPAHTFSEHMHTLPGTTSALCQVLAHLRVRAGIARACALHHSRRDTCQLSGHIVAVPIRAPLCWCECVRVGPGASTPV